MEVLAEPISRQPQPDARRRPNLFNRFRGCKGVMDRAVDHIGPATRPFDHPITCVAQMIDIIAGSTRQRVGTGCIAEKLVGEGISSQRPPCAAHGVDQLN